MNDPLVYKGSLRARWGHEMLKAMDSIMANLGQIEWPFLILQGEADRIVSSKGATTFCAGAASVDKTIKLYSAAFHELLFDSDAAQVRAPDCLTAGSHVSFSIGIRRYRFLD